MSDDTDEKDGATTLTEVQQEALHRTTSDVLRTIAGHKDHTLSFTGNFTGTHRLPVKASHVTLPKLDDKRQRTLLRGVADRAAFMVNYSHPDLRERTTPVEDRASKLFERMEQLRCEILGGRALPGANNNIMALVAHEMVNIEEGLEDSVLGLNEDALYLVLRKALGGDMPDLPQNVQETLESLGKQIPDDFISELSGQIEDQQRFAEAAHKVLKSLYMSTVLPPPPPEEEDEPESGDDDSKQDNSDGGENRQSAVPEDQLDHEEPAATDEESDEAENAAEPDDTAQDGDPQPSQETQSGTPPQQNKKALSLNTPRNKKTIPEIPAYDAVLAHYKIYDDSLDVVEKASDILEAQTPMARRNLRAEFDHIVRLAGAASGRDAMRLQRRLQSYTHNFLTCERDLEDGLLDTSRLSRIITSTDDPRCYMQQSEHEELDTVVGILVDNSGSMRGKNIQIALSSAFLLAQALERCRIKTEIMGYTTTGFGKGPIYGKWTQNDRPHEPGRLNSLRHIIYKTADEPLRRARDKLSMMLDNSGLKENIDGEALLWAHGRMMARPEQRKILVMVADGAPCDRDTEEGNGANYLSEHFKAAAQMIEEKSTVELAGIGMDHNLGEYITNAVMVTDPENVSRTLFKQVEGLFLPPNLARRQQARQRQRKI